MCINLCDKIHTSNCRKVSIYDTFLHPNLRGDWYLINVNSIPAENMEGIITDIYLDKFIKIENGTIVRVIDDDILDLDTIKQGLNEVVGQLENKEVTFLLFDNNNINLFNGQPLAFIVNPLINRSTVSYHRHINNGYFSVYGSSIIDSKMTSPIFFLDESNVGFNHVLRYHIIPESICYIHDVEDLDVDGYSKLEVAYATMVAYIFRNEIFMKFYECHNEIFWLGAETPFPEFAKGHLLSVNYYGKCHCGNDLSYKDCHFKIDFEKYLMTIDKNRIFDIDNLKKAVIMTENHFTYNSKRIFEYIINKFDEEMIS